jgi:hypothetical protein
MPIEYTHGIRQYIRFYFKNVIAKENVTHLPGFYKTPIACLVLSADNLGLED